MRCRMGGMVDSDAIDNRQLIPLVIVAPAALMIGAFLIVDAIAHRKRFSLRTLFASITIAALMLGWLVYALRK